MKKYPDLEDALLDSGELMRRAGASIIGNMGKIIALFVAVIMLAVTFTDITFKGVFTKEFASSLLLILTSSYIIYFSLEDAGEKCGFDTEEYKHSKERYDRMRERISGDDIETLRGFCTEYARRELEFRRKNALLSAGLSEAALDALGRGEAMDKKTKRRLRKIAAIKPIPLTPKTLLCTERASGRSELESPERRKFISLILKLIPSTVCMTVTVSVMLTAKEGLTASDILNGILSLSALPMMGFKGYSAGYTYAKHSLSLWCETRANILEDFLISKGKA